MNKKCPNCRLVNFPEAIVCVRCGAEITHSDVARPAILPTGQKVAKRVAVCVFACLAALAGFYVSLVFSATSLNYDQRKTVENSIRILDEKGFTHEASILRRIAVFRSTDNWLNASVAKENAFAATNFPFEIVTLYPDFFAYTADDTERAAVLLHEARHLQGEDEKQAYEYVWRNRQKLGWTSQVYGGSVVWIENRKQTREYVPNLFVCEVNPFGDCTESPIFNF